MGVPPSAAYPRGDRPDTGARLGHPRSRLSGEGHDDVPRSPTPVRVHPRCHRPSRCPGVYAQTPEISVREKSCAVVGKRRAQLPIGRSAPAYPRHGTPRSPCTLAHHGGCYGKRTLPHGNSPVFDRWHEGLCRRRLWLFAQRDPRSFRISVLFRKVHTAGRPDGNFWGLGVHPRTAGGGRLLERGGTALRLTPSPRP